jgi:hypothetical protein
MAGLLRRILLSEFSLRLKEKRYPKNDPDINPLIINAMKRFRNCDNKKNKTRIRREINVSKKYWKCYPYHYFTNNLYQADNELTDEELINYIPNFFWYNIFLPYYSSPAFNIIGENKIIMEQLFTALKIPHPEILCIILNGQVYSSDMTRLNGDQVQTELLRNNPEKLFVKPADRCGGKGIYIFHKTNSGHFVTQDNVVLNQFFLDTLGKDQDYIIQHGITQCREISEIYPESVNTIRIVTENKNGLARIICAMLRVGRYHKEIDNLSSGGIGVNIDIPTGKLGNYAMSLNEEKFALHPDTHVVFRNITLSEWGNIQKFAMESASKIPFLTYLGWDIALTPIGPVVIEINRTPALYFMETLSGGGLREDFGIQDPGFYWKNLGKKTVHPA